MKCFFLSKPVQALCKDNNMSIGNEYCNITCASDIVKNK